MAITCNRDCPIRALCCEMRKKNSKKREIRKFYKLKKKLEKTWIKTWLSNIGSKINSQFHCCFCEFVFPFVLVYVLHSQATALSVCWPLNLFKEGAYIGRTPPQPFFAFFSCARYLKWYDMIFDMNVSCVTCCFCFDCTNKGCSGCLPCECARVFHMLSSRWNVFAFWFLTVFEASSFRHPWFPYISLCLTVKTIAAGLHFSPRYYRL